MRGDGDLSKQGPRDWLCRAAGAGLRPVVRHWEDDIPSRGRGTGFAGPQAQRPPRGAGSDTQCATVGA
jgi:hypothetical protein